MEVNWPKIDAAGAMDSMPQMSDELAAMYEKKVKQMATSLTQSMWPSDPLQAVNAPKLKWKMIRGRRGHQGRPDCFPTVLGERIIIGTRFSDLEFEAVLDTPAPETDPMSDEEVKALRAEYRHAFPKCEITKLLDRSRDEDWLQIKRNWCHNDWVELHHIFGRGKDREVWCNYLMLSGQAHEWMHRHWRQEGMVVALWTKMNKHTDSRYTLMRKKHKDIPAEFDVPQLDAATGKGGGVAGLPIFFTGNEPENVAFENMRHKLAGHLNDLLVKQQEVWDAESTARLNEKQAKQPGDGGMYDMWNAKTKP